MPLLAPIKFQPTPASVEAYRAVLAEKVALSEEIPAKHMHDAQAAVWRSVMAGGGLLGALKQQPSDQPKNLFRSRL
jgi:hypothetical protein